MNEVILGLIMHLCQSDKECVDRLDKCVTKKYWERYEISANRDFPDQLLMDFVYECHEEK